MKTRTHAEQDYITMQAIAIANETGRDSFNVELEILRAENTRLREQRDRLVGVSQAVVDRWHTPLWKDAPATAGYINALSAILAEIEGEKS